MSYSGDFKAHWSFDIHGVRQYVENCTGRAGIVNTTAYKTEQILQVLGMAKCPIF